MPGIDARTLKSLLPAEHGSYTFVAEPLLIGLAIGGFRNNWEVALAIPLLFFAYRPARLAVADASKRKRYPRTVAAFVAGAAFGLPALVLLAHGASAFQGVKYLLAIGIAAAVAFVAVDLRSKPQGVARELTGALLSVPFAAALASQSAAVPVWLVLAILAARALAAVLSVRGAFARHPDAPACRIFAVACAVAIAALAVTMRETLGAAVVAAYGIVVLRTAWLTATPSRPRKAQVVGMQELAVAALCVLAWFSTA